MWHNQLRIEFAEQNIAWLFTLLLIADTGAMPPTVVRKLGCDNNLPTEHRHTNALYIYRCMYKYTVLLYTTRTDRL